MEAVIGKKSGPAPPPAPDPVATSQAQAQANKEGAIAQANLNRIDQYTPQGNITYQQIGTNADGTPKYKQTQQYSPEQQSLYDQQNQVDRSLNGLAVSNVNRVNQAQSTPFSYDGMTPMVNGVGGGLPGMQYGTPNAGVKYGPESAGQINKGIGDAGGVQTAFAGGGPLQSNVQPGQVQSAITGGGDISKNIAWAGPQKNGYENGGAVSQLSGQEGGNVQTGLNYSGATKLPGINDFGAEAKRTQDAVYAQAASRLDPQFQQQQSDIEARLANQGIARGSEAFNREIGNYDRSRTDAYNQANFSSIQAGSAEQSRLFNQAMGARQQGVNEANAQGSFANQAQGQIFGQAANTVGLNNQAQGQRNNQNSQAAQFFNDAQKSTFDQNAAQAQFGNQAQAQQFGQNTQQGQFANQAQQQTFQQGQQNAGLQNSASAQQFQNNQAQAAFANDAQGQIFGQQKDKADFGNQAQAQQYTQNLSDAQQHNSGVGQAFQQGQANAALNNTARGQSFNEQISNGNFQNAARQQQIQEATYLRNLPLNEIAALLGTGGGVQNPTFQNVSQVGVAPADYQGAVYNSYNGQMNAWQQQQANKGSIFGSIAGALGTGAGLALSDRRVKRDIKPVGVLPNGIPTYAFRYLDDDVQQFGVMAQDVMGVLPDAVAANDDGVLMVDYRKVCA